MEEGCCLPVVTFGECDMLSHTALVCASPPGKSGCDYVFSHCTGSVLFFSMDFFFVLLAFSFMRTKRTCSFWDLFEIPGQNTEDLGREDLTMDFSDVAVGWEPSLYYLQPFCPGFHISLHHFFLICLTENLGTKGFTQYLQTIKNCMLGQLPRILLLYTGSRPVILHETSQRFLYFIPIRHKTRFA